MKVRDVQPNHQECLCLLVARLYGPAAVIADLLDDDLGTAKFDGKTWANPQHAGGHAAGHFIKWHTIANQAASVLQDVRRIREHPLVPAGIPIYGYVYDVHSGRLEEVKEATVAGRAGK
jgi:carbonic anhydrase